MPAMSQQRKLAARAARRFPQRPFDAARVTGSTALDLIVTLYGLPARGVCATTAANAAKTGSSGERALALAHPVCPPPAVLTAARNASPVEALLVSGTPGWAARPYKDESLNGVGLAADPRCSAGLLHVWGETSRTTPTRADDVAANPAVPPRLLSRLAADSDRVVRSAAAANPNCPRWLLAPLSGDTSSDVRVAAAANPTCPPHLLAGLANDPDRMVRAAVAARCDCPPRLLAGLVRDPRPEVRSAAAATAASACSSSLLEDFCVDACSEARAVVAARIDCPPPLLRHLLLDPVMGVRVAAAANPSCPPPQRSPLQLLRFSMFEIRAAVAANPNCPRWRLRRFARDPHCEVRCAVAAAGACAPRSLRRLARDPRPEVRAIVAARPDCPSQLLAKLAADNDHRTRVAATANPNCPQSSFADLVHDSYDIVRAAATENLECPPQHLNVALKATTLGCVTRRRSVSTVRRRCERCSPATTTGESFAPPRPAATRSTRAAADVVTER